MASAPELAVPIPPGPSFGLLTVAEAAASVRVSDQCVRRAIRGGKLHALRFGTQLRIERAELARFIGVDCPA